MPIMVLGAIVGLVVLVMALSGAKFARETMILIVCLMAAGLLAIWFSSCPASERSPW